MPLCDLPIKGIKIAMNDCSGCILYTKALTKAATMFSSYEIIVMKFRECLFKKSHFYCDPQFLWSLCPLLPWLFFLNENHILLSIILNCIHNSISILPNLMLSRHTRNNLLDFRKVWSKYQNENYVTSRFIFWLKLMLKHPHALFYFLFFFLFPIEQTK